MGSDQLDTVRQLRIEGLLPDADWEELAHLGVLDVILITTPGSAFVSAVAVLSWDGSSVHTWALAERPNFESARSAARFLLGGLAGLRRLTKEKHPWAPSVPDVEGNSDQSEARAKAVHAAVDEWHRVVSEALQASVLIESRLADAEDRRRRAAAGAPIREARKRWKLTQAVLAQQANIRPAVLSEIERGLSVPDARTQAQLAEALDADAETLFSGFADPSPSVQ